MIKIPPNNQWTQPNTSDITGSLYASYNLDLTNNEGKLQLGKRMVLNVNQSDTGMSGLTNYPVGFKYFLSKYWTLGGTTTTGALFNSSTIDGAFAVVAGTSGLPTNIDSQFNDIEIFVDASNNPILYISGNDSKVYYSDSTNGLTWNSLTAGLVSVPVMLCAFPATLRMYCSKGGQRVQSWTPAQSVSSPFSQSNNNVAYTLWLPNNLSITFMKDGGSYMWIGVVDTSGGKGFVYRWDGVTSYIKSQDIFRLESSGALSCVIKDGVPWVIDTNGDLLTFNGGTFIRKGGLNRVNNKILFNPYILSNQRFIHPNGMAIIQGSISALIDGTNFDASSHNGTQEETIPSGIWEYDEKIGFYHKYSLGLTKTGATIGDFGQTRIYGVGGLADVISGTSPITTDGTFLAGASYYTDATSSATPPNAGIFYNNSKDTLQKAGYFVTPKIYSQEIEDMWNKVFVRHKKLLNATDKYVVKYRIFDTPFTEATLTWTSTTTFTVPTASFTTAPAVGDEVEVIQGNGAGRLSHITVISTSGANYVVTVDETYATCTSGTAKARFCAWVKIGSQTNQNEKQRGFPINKNSTWVQFKVWMLFTGANEIDDLILQNTPFAVV